MARIAIGMLGTNLDAGRSETRWDRWRPTVSLVQHPLELDGIELLYDDAFQELAEQVAADIESVSPQTRVSLVPVHLADPWDFEQVYAVLHDFARDYPFRDGDDYLVHITTGTHVAQICMFLLTESRYFPARLLQTSPPRPRSAGGPGSFAIIDLDLSRYDQIARRFRREHEESLVFLKQGIETRNAAFNRLIEQIEHVAIRSRDPMLLMGPTGAGKSQLARQIFQLKKRRRQVEGELVEVNCATLRGDQAMAALFGHTKGAFTGAQRGRPGLLKRADRGLLFLDEVGELGPDEQAMLLRAIEMKTFLPVGSDDEVQSEFQLIAGTNRPLVEAVRSGRFREDLLARIDLWTFRLPGLAERSEDIEPNLQFELERVGARLGFQVTFNAEAKERYLSFATSAEAIWAANFRDFSASVTRMATLAPGGRIDVATVEEEMERLRAGWSGQPMAVQTDAIVDQVLGDRAAGLDPFDRVQLALVLRVCATSPSLSAAGRVLFRESRKHRKTTNDADRLRKYLAKYELDFQTIQRSLATPSPE
ncbi:MAG: RNA repair transcriptional activator RtcR [Myxococcota bacterium]